MTTTLHSDLYGWWRILETPGWPKGLDALGPAMLSHRQPRQAANALFACLGECEADPARCLIHVGGGVGVRSSEGDWERESFQGR
jgi:hypothetical protein